MADRKDTKPWQIKGFPVEVRRAIVLQAQQEGLSVSEFMARLATDRSQRWRAGHTADLHALVQTAALLGGSKMPQEMRTLAEELVTERLRALKAVPT